MKLRADITFEVEVGDYIEAAEHQRSANSIFDSIKDRYPQAVMSFRQLRLVQTASPAPARAPRSRGTGALAQYEERP